MPRWTTPIAIACLLLGCAKTQPDPDSGPANPAERSRPTAPPDLRACKADADCTMSGRSFEGEHACCVSPCISEAVNADALETFASACKGTFTQSECIRHHCAPPPPTMVRCIEETCTAVEGPVIMTHCEADDDCALIDVEIRDDDLCCPRCPEAAARADSLKAYAQWCADQPLAEPCPEAECASNEQVAACVEGQCAVRAADPT